LLFNVTLEYGSKKGQVNQERLESNGNQQSLVCADNVSILAENIITTK